MRILFVLHQYMPRHVTGTEQYARALARGLRQRGHAVQVFAFEPLIQFEAPGQLWFERDEVVEEVPVRRVSVHPVTAPNRELGEYESPLAAGMFLRWFQQQRFDLVHVFHPRNLGSVVLTEPMRLGVPVVVHLMDFFFLCPNFLLLRRDGALCDGPPDGGFGCVGCMDPALQQAVDELALRPHLEALADLPPPAAGLAVEPARRAHALVARKPRMFQLLAGVAAVVAPSRFMRETFEAQGFPKGVIRHMPYGLDVGRFGDVRVPEQRRRGPLRVGYVGSMSRHKGVHLLIEAVRGLAQDVRLELHGGLESHPEYSEELQRLAAGDDRIAFRGRFEPGDLGRVLHGLDVLAVPSLWHENTPFSVLEALHFRTPVVASDIGGIREIVQHERNGLLFPMGDVAALAACLGRLVDDAELVRRLAAGAAVPPIEQNLDQLEQLYREVSAEVGR